MTSEDEYTPRHEEPRNEEDYEDLVPYNRHGVQRFRKKRVAGAMAQSRRNPYPAKPPNTTKGRGRGRGRREDI